MLIRHDRYVDQRHRQIADEIAARLGQPGDRARGFLEAASALVGPLAGATPKSDELSAYALREALTSITAGIDVSGGQFRTHAREVVAAADAANAAPDDPIVSARLFEAIDGLRSFVAAPAGHETRMIRLIQRRTGDLPLRLDPDPVTEYQQLVGAAADALHGNAKDVKALVERVFELLGRLFAPPDVALDELDRFVAITNPTAEDAAELASRLVSASHLRYFTERAAAPGWLEALRGSPLALPDQRWPGWPVGDLALRVAADDPGLAASWLADTTQQCRPLDANSAFNFARTAAGIGRVATGVLVKLLKADPQNRSVGAFAHQVMESVEADDPVVDQLADVLLQDVTDEWRTGQVVAALAAGATAATCEQRLRLLAYKLRQHARSNPGGLGGALYGVGSLANAVVHDDLMDGAERLIAGAAMVARNGIASGGGDAVLRGAAELPSPVREQMRAWLLGTAGLGSTAEAIAAVAEDIKTTDATYDHLGLVDRAWAEDSDAAMAAWVDALGNPPPQETLAQCLAAEKRRATVWRVRSWCVALPRSVTEPWLAVAEAVARHPVPSREALAPHEGPDAMSGGHPPISIEDLAAMDIDEAADWVAAWRPGPDDWLVSARELGRALADVVKQHPQAWAEKLPGIIERLRHPTYVGHLFDGLREGADSIVGFMNALADSAQLVASEPWEAEPLGEPDGFDYDKTWEHARAAVLSLLESLAVAGADVAAERPDMFELALARARDRGDRSGLDGHGDPMRAAINRASMRALYTTIVLGWRSVRNGRPVPPGLLDLLDEVVALDGADGMQARAILVRAVDLLRESVPDWMASRKNRLFGDAAPAQLGQRTVDLALSRGGVRQWMLDELRDQIFMSATRGDRNGQSHVLIAMVNGVDGYSVDAVASWVMTLSVPSISAVVSTIGRLLRDEERSEVLARGVELVNVLTAQDISPGALAGLGRWYGVNGLADDEWTRLMLDAVRRGTVLLDAELVAGRASASRTVTPETFLLLEKLLSATSEPWTPSQIADAALQALHAQTERSDEREALRAALLERGYFGARDL